MKIEKYIGESGVPSKMSVAQTLSEKSAFVQRLEEGGCCAWVGKGRCGARPCLYFENEKENELAADALMFQLYASFAVPRSEQYPNGFIGFWLCKRHEEDHLADMDKEVEKNQRREFFKLMTGEMVVVKNLTPDSCLDIWRNFIDLMHQRTAQIAEFSRWSLCSDERADVIASQIGYWCANAQVVLWNCDMWHASGKGFEDFGGTKYPESGVPDIRQFWIIERPLIFAPENRKAFELPDDAELANVLVVRTKTENTDKAATIVLIFQSPETRYPILRCWPPVHVGDEIVEFPVAYILARLRFMSLDIVSTEIMKPSRAVRRRAMKAGDWLPDIKTVTLRRKIYPKHDSSTMSHVDWHCSWIVAGHWRKQWYPSKHDHEVIYIDSYVKGPSDKPLKPPSQSLYVVAR